MMDKNAQIEKSGHLGRSRFFIILGLVITFGVFSSPPFDSLTYTNLMANMVQHFGMLIFSAVFGYGLAVFMMARTTYREKSKRMKLYAYIEHISKKSRGMVFAVIFPSIIITFWNLPWNFDFAATDVLAHLLEHISYMLAGILIGISIPEIPKKLRIVLLWVAFMQMGMMGSMMLVWEPGFYTAYPAIQNQIVNTSMMLIGAAGVSVMSVYLLKEMDVV
jgi:cytochrome c oxidase assembly factor CtaG